MTDKGIMLEAREIHSGYDKVEILHGVSLRIDKGKIVAMIGRNGVGKSTFAKSIIGLLPIPSGSILFNEGMDITKWPAYRRARAGIAYVPQGHGIFPELTVEENLKIGALINQKKKEEAYDRVYEYFPRLAERRTQTAGTMSGGEQAMLSISRVLINIPEIIILDEPSEGVQPNIVQQMGDIILKIKEDYEITVLIIEQNLELIQQVSGSAYVMDKGRIVTHLTKDEINNDRVITQYLSV